MADPVTLAIAAAAVSATTSIVGGFAARGQAEYQRDVMRNNASLASQRAAAEGAQQARETRLALSRRRAGAAAQGVEFSGSILNVAADEAIEAELENRFIAHRGAVEVQDFRNRGRMARREGQLAVIGGFAEATGTLLSAGGGIAEMNAARTPTGGGKSAAKVAKTGTT